jgi:GNAT superfamily N-acetyltransferase
VRVIIGAAMSDFTLRPITPDDAVIVARHRTAMFVEMGSLAASDADAMVDATAEYLRPAIARGEYYGWLALAAGQEGVETVAGGAGVQLRPQLPRPKPGGGLLTGRQGIILNVYVDPAFRRRGLARRLVAAAIDWARAQQLAGLVLHASDAGRPLYEQLGFVSTNEMRFTGGLAEASASRPRSE